MTNSLPASAKPAPIDVSKAQDIIFQPNDGPQTDFLSASEQEVLYGGAAGGGKAQPLSATVETPTGPVTMGEITVGDFVCTPDGGSAKVIQEHPQGIVDVYELEFQDGVTVECTLDHLWYCKAVRDGSERWKARTLREIINSGRTFVVPLGLVEYAPREYEISPYAMGSLLGDGGMTTNSISFTTADQESIDELTKEGLKLNKRSSKYAYGVVGINPILRKHGLIGTSSHTKFIPDEYLLGSYEQRLSLLQGLLDTDGYATPDGKVNYTSVSSTLLDQVAQLVRSIGGTANKMANGHTLYIRHPKTWSLFRLGRKVNRCSKERTINNKLVGISYVGKKVCKCITIDSEQQLYITNGSIVTHNSFAMVADPVRYVNNPKSAKLLVRRSTEELRELISISKKMYPAAIPGAKFLEREKTWVFPSGATLWMSYLDRDDDVERYQGQAFNWIGFDELTQWNTPFAWDYMRSRLRTSKDSGLDLIQRATTNPGGIGHHWVKKTFIDPAPHNTTFDAQSIDGTPLVWPSGSKKEGQPLFQRKFIPATLFDNPYLAEDGMYEANLLSLPEHKRRQLLEGDWSVAEGAAFPEFNVFQHVIEPFDIPDSWVRFRAADYGYSSHTGVVWFAISPSEQLIVYRELYVSKVTAADLAPMVLRAEQGDRISYGVLDSSLWHKRGDTGPSLAEQMIIRGCRWRPSDRSSGSRVAGKNELHRRLAIDEMTEEPKIVFFNTCRHLISQLPSLPLSKNNAEDVDTNAEDHLYDALRYGIMTRPRSDIFSHTPEHSRHSGFQAADSTFGY